LGHQATFFLRLRLWKQEISACNFYFPLWKKQNEAAGKVIHGPEHMVI